MPRPEIVIYHNARCSKSRAACELVAEQGFISEIINYLTKPPTHAELRSLLDKLGMKPGELVRKGEEIYKQHYAGKSLSDAQWIDALITHPILIERPIVVRGERAVIGRPPEKVLELFDDI